MLITDQAPAMPRVDFDSEWERCKDWIAPALDEGGDFYTVGEVRDMVRAGEATFWPGRRSAIVTQFWFFPRKKALHYWLVGGDLDEILQEMQPVLEDWAKGQGCNLIVSAGRKGWERALKPYGHTPLWTALMKEIA